MFGDLICILGLLPIVIACITILATFGKVSFDHEFSFMGYVVGVEFTQTTLLEISVNKKV